MQTRFLAGDFLKAGQKLGRGIFGIPFPGIWKDGGKHDALIVGESAGFHPIARARGGLDPVDAVAHFDDIGVEFENAAFGKEELHPKCIVSFQPLAHPRTPLPEKKGAGALHGDGGGAARVLAGALAALARELDLPPIESVMLKEALIFGHPGRLEKIARHLPDISPFVETLLGMPAIKSRFDLAQEHQRRHRRIDPPDSGDLKNRREERGDEHAKRRPNPGPPPGG